MNLTGATPTEQARPVASRMAVFMARAMVSGGPKSVSQPLMST